ncbi:hypothetical protein [Nocardia sp. alder85J]|uniref:hypothetical protein n=1 Tax=Nocardia sp. alder85J TaxID=2862949 RepID=UPI001CD2B0EC|nr:hypothetical protein [Nocardia sp. alder85J]MCX4092930.1 hypothetical protein [Nocardia sp. alder85J]
MSHDSGSGNSTGSGAPVGPVATSGSGPAPLYVDPAELATPTKAITAAGTHLSTLELQLGLLLVAETVDTVLSDTGPFGDSAVQSAWHSFHTAWMAETKVSAGAVTEAAKLVSDSAASYQEGDTTGGRVVGSVSGG